MLKIPSNNNEWAEEALNAYKQVLDDLGKGKPVAGDKYNLFRVAPLIAAANRGISRAKKIDIFVIRSRH